ncbi:Calcium channel YVC1 [Wickerhamiella sorbophila]|uniref:Calcium channel YVC1 n=1 Tax=Wickerhamiella sorbophila TaxID=45607 RepID=A0A2T0FMV2_9ASCO|nr:Calcium channel YVC1 [Wickerhamiella sorbophila]PRT56333.1 Calcium channel YVC1 [Wickerhamiella sorbophila]
MTDSADQIDAEHGVEWPLLPVNQPCKLDSISVSSVCRDISDLIVAHISSDDEAPINTQDVHTISQALKDIIHGNYMSGAVFYALLASRIHFASEAKRGPALAQLLQLRAEVCQEIASQLLEDIPHDEAAQYIVFAFYPFADGVDDETQSVPYWLRVSALELAIHGEAKRFLAHPVMVSIVDELWSGTLVFDPFIYKAHRIRVRTRRQLSAILYARKGILGRYSPEHISIFKPSRLRVPCYRHYLKIGSVLVLVALYLKLIFNWRSEPSFNEAVFSLWAVGFVLDEFTNIKYIGWRLYSLSLWGWCDLCTTAAILCYWVFRFLALHLVNNATAIDTLNKWALNVLILAAIVLIPRASSILEANKSFARLAISMRKLSIDLIYCVVAVVIFSIGFSASLTAFAKGVFQPSEVVFSQLQIFFGFTPAVWLNWEKYSFPGALTLFLYLFLAQFVVSTMVSAALNSRYRDISEHSLEEYHYHCAVRVQSKIKSEHSSLFFFAEPFNTINWLLFPIQYFIPIQRYLGFTRFILKLTHMPVFLCIYLYEGTLVRFRTHKQKQADEQHERLQNYLNQRVGNRAPKPHIQRKRRGAHVDVERSMAPRASKFDLVEEVLSSNVEPVSGSSVPASRLDVGPSPSFAVREPTLRRQYNPRKNSVFSLSRESDLDTLRLQLQRRRFSIPFELDIGSTGDYSEANEFLDDLKRQNKRIEVLLGLICAKLDIDESQYRF